MGVGIVVGSIFLNEDFLKYWNAVFLHRRREIIERFEASLANNELKV